MMEFPVIPTPNPAKVARMMDITACKCSCRRPLLGSANHEILLCTAVVTISSEEEVTGFMLAYISVEEVGEEDDEEELDRRVDPHVPS
jgi:hypothetical protein